MNGSEKTEAQLPAELASLRARVAELEQAEAERKWAEEALRASETNYREIFNAANDAIFVHDMETGEILDVNQKISEMFGYTPEEARQLNVGALSSGEPPYTQADARRLVREVAQGGPQVVEWMAKDKAGRLFWVQVNLKRATIGGKDRVLAVVRDISERRQAEEATRVFTRSMEESRDGIVLTDADSHITFMNRSAEEFFGLSHNALLGRVLHEAFVVDPQTRAKIDADLADQGRWSGLVEVACGDSDPLAIDFTHLLISDEQGKDIATVSFATDARQTRRLESVQQMAEDVARTEVADDEAIQRIMSYLPELVGLDRWAIYLHNPGNETLEIRFSSEGYQEAIEATSPIPIAGTLNGQVFRRGEILVSPDVLNDHRFTNNPTFRPKLSLVKRLNLRATCILPLRAGRRILGTLGVADLRVRTFTPEELNVLRTMASQIGLLLSRARHEQLSPRFPSLPEPAIGVTVVAESDAMKSALIAAEQIASTDLPVILLGPTGVGKGHVAKYIHAIGPRANEPFLAVNCACLDGDLILSELFGHERGAFTGAVRRQKGCFELAHGGTLLLDEVIELPKPAQAKLLQVVETQQFRRLGGQETIATDVRIICTTNGDIRECVRSGKFRQDLYYRLNTAEILIPPLRDRPEDVEPLALGHLRTQALASGEPIRKLTDGALARLREYHWPGNVRELQNVLTQASAQDGRVISARDLRFTPIIDGFAAADHDSGGRSERDAILDVLRRHRWNRTLAARELGIHRNTLRDRMRKYGISV